jgi:hypothetical protein
MNIRLLHIHVITNTESDADKRLLHELVEPFMPDNTSLSIEGFWNPIDPKEMTWRHKRLFDDVFFPSTELTHFLYVEDDMRFSMANLEYWLSYKERLEAVGLLPGFVRYELRGANNTIYLSDNVYQTPLEHNLIEVKDESFLTPHNPYPALYIVDRLLAEEYRKSKSFDPRLSEEIIGWPSTERSAMGLMFENRPMGRSCRFVVPYNPGRKTPHWSCLVHHLPNTFANGERAGLAIEYGSLPLRDFAAADSP